MALKDNAWDLDALVVADLPFNAYYDDVAGPPGGALADFLDTWYEVAIPTPGEPLPPAVVRRFGITSSLGDPVDSFDLDLTGVEFFTAPDPLRRLTFSVGLLEPDNSETLIAQLRQGELYDMRLVGDASSRQLTVRGLDAMAAMVRNRINKEYLLRDPGTPIGTGSPGPTGTGPYVPKPPERAIGQRRASQIAAELAARAGLTLAWGCRDYLLREDFLASGRLIDVLGQLIEPWCLAEPYRVDVMTRNRVLVVQARPLAPAPEYTHTIAASRISNLTIDRVEGPTYGDVVLFGRRVSAELKPTGGGSFGGGSVTLLRVDETRSLAGRLTSLIETRETFRMPDRLLLESDRRTYTRKGASGSAMVMTQQDLTHNDFEPTTYGPNGPLNQPLQKHGVVETYSNTASNPKMILRQRNTTDFGYDSNRFLRSVSTLIEKYNKGKNTVLPSQQEITTYQDAAYQQVEQTTCTYTFNKKGEPILQTRHTQFNAGYRVGGSRPPGGGVTGPEGALNPIWSHVVVSTGHHAVPFSYSNPHLDAADLAFIRERLVAASGLFGYTLTFTGPVMPWLRKGSYLLLTDYQGPTGEPIPLAPALVTDVVIGFDAGDNPSSVATVTAKFWRKE